MKGYKYNAEGQPIVYVVMNGDDGLEGVFRSQAYAMHIATYEVSNGYVVEQSIDEADA